MFDIIFLAFCELAVHNLIWSIAAGSCAQAPQHTRSIAFTAVLIFRPDLLATVQVYICIYICIYTCYGTSILCVLCAFLEYISSHEAGCPCLSVCLTWQWAPSSLSVFAARPGPLLHRTSASPPAVLAAIPAHIRTALAHSQPCEAHGHAAGSLLHTSHDPHMQGPT